MANSCVSASNQGMIDQGSINWYQSSHDLDIGARNWQSVDIYGGLGASRAVPKELQPWQRADPSPHEWQPWQGYGGHSGTGTWQASPHERSSSTNGKIPQHKDSIDRMIDKFDHINSRLELVLKELGRQREEIESQLCRKVFPPNSCMNPNPNTLISSPMDYKNPSQLNLSNVHDMSFPLSHTGSNPYQDSYVSHSSSIPRTQQEYQCYSDPNLGHNLENNTGNSCHQPSSYPGPGSIPAQSTPDLHPQISTLSVHPQSGNWSVHDGLVPSRSATIEWQRDNDNGEAIFSEEETISTIHPTTNGKGNIEDATPDVNEVDKNIFPVFTTNCFALLTKPEFLSDEQAWHCECSFENVESLDDLGAVENTSGFRFFHSQVVYIVRDPGSIQLFQFKSTELWGSKRAVSSKDREKDVADPRGNHGVTEHCHTTSTTRGYLKARKYLLEWKAQESSNQCVYHLMCSHGECNNNRGSKKLSISDTISHVAKGKSNNKTRINGLDKLPLKGFDILVSNDSYSYPSQIAALGLPWSSHDKKSSHSELDSVQVIVQIAHCIAQGEIDRGFDVSASIFGKWNHGSVKQWLKTNLEECKGTWNFFEKWSSTFEEQLQKLFRFSEIQIEGPQHPMKVWDPGGRGVHQLQTISSPSFLHIRRLGNHRS